jgi:hypothetical protein
VEIVLLGEDERVVNEELKACLEGVLDIAGFGLGVGWEGAITSVIVEVGGADRLAFGGAENRGLDFVSVDP